MSLDGVNLGNAYGRIIISDNVNEAVAQAQRSFNSGIQGMGQSMQAFGDSLTGIGARITALTAPITAFGATGIRAAANFDEVLQEISARTGLVGDDLDSIRQAAVQFGADTAFSATEAAQAFLELLSSGQSAEEALQTLPTVLTAAAAGGIDLKTAADAVTDIMASFQLEVSQAGDVVDSLARASAASSADIASLQQGFGNVGGVAAQFGLTVDETAAILAIFSENGIKGAEAGTQLRSMLLNMTRPTEGVQAAWGELGISLYDAEGNMRDMNSIMGDLRREMNSGRRTQQEMNELLTTIGGSYGIMGLTALSAGQSIEDMQALMSQQADATDVADARMNTFNGTIESLAGSIETFQIEVLTPFMNDFLRPLAERAIEVVNSMTAWAQQNPETANTLIMIGAALVTVGPALMGLGIAISTVGAGIAFLASPLALVAAAATAFAVAFVTDFGGVRTFIMEQVVPAFEDFGAWFTDTLLPEVMPIFEDFGGLLGSIWDTVSPALGALAAWFLESGLPLIQQTIMEVFVPGLKLFIGVLQGIWNLVGPPLGEMLTWFTETGLPAVTQFLSETVIPLIGDFIALLAGIWQDLQQPLTALRDGVVGIFEDIIGIAGDVVQAVQDVINTIGNLDQTGEGNGGLFGSGIGPDFDPLGGIRGLFDNGGFAPPNSIAHVGAGQMGREAFMVGDEGGTFYPDFAANLAEIATGVMAGAQMAPPDLPQSGLSQPGQQVVVNIEVPLDVLRNEPGLETNGETLAQSIQDAIRRRG